MFNNIHRIPRLEIGTKKIRLNCVKNGANLIDLAYVSNSKEYSIKLDIMYLPKKKLGKHWKSS